MTELERVIEFAKSKSVLFDSIYFECEWKEYKVYSRSFYVEGDLFIGLPIYFLIDKQDNIRLANPDEVFEILDSLPDEENLESIDDMNVILDGSNELASQRLEEMIRRLENKEKES